MLVLIITAIVCLLPQDIGEGYTYDQIKALIGTDWKLTGEKYLFALDKPEMPDPPSEIQYHTTAVIYKGDTFRLIDYEIDYYTLWWKVRVTSGEFKHSAGWFANKWREKWCTKVEQ